MRKVRLYFYCFILFFGRFRLTSYELSNLLKVTVEIVLIRSSMADKFRRGKEIHRKRKKSVN